MAHLTLLESTVGFVLLLAGIYAFLWGLWFLGVRFVPAWPFISLLRQTQRERSQDRGNPASLLNEYLKRRRNSQASGRCPSCGKALVVRIDSKGKFSKPTCPECRADARAKNKLRARRNDSP
jgi:predicted RNA-binding Zn-ribbon protein involved in translation (DUF1610 family)